MGILDGITRFLGCKKDEEDPFYDPYLLRQQNDNPCNNYSSLDILKAVKAPLQKVRFIFYPPVQNPDPSTSHDEYDSSLLQPLIISDSSSDSTSTEIALVTDIENNVDVVSRKISSSITNRERGDCVTTSTPDLTGSLARTSVSQEILDSAVVTEESIKRKRRRRRRRSKENVTITSKVPAVEEEKEDVKGIRWIKHYSSHQHILLVGEGDFSFSLCLAMAFCSAINIVATSLDSYDELMKKYKNAKANLAVLGDLGATILHAVDATTMSSLPHLQRKKFHRIIFNFPHAGFHGNESNPDLIMMHRNLVRGFLRNASSMVQPVDGEIHVSHKITAPYDLWRIEDLASECSLHLFALDDFRIIDYPGYNNKRGSGSRSDQPFPLGECRTFRFILCPASENRAYQHWQPPVNPSPFPSNANSTSECLRIFGGYLNHVEETFGSTSYDDVCQSVREALRLGFEMYVGTAPRRPLSGYISILEELQRLSILRAVRLRQMLLISEQRH